MPGVEDVIYRKVAAPRSQPYEYEGAVHHHRNHQPGQIDPALLQQRQTHLSGYGSLSQEAMYYSHARSDELQHWPYAPSPYTPVQRSDTPYFELDPALDGSQIQDAHVEMLKGNQDGWQVNPAYDGDDFEKWMIGNHH